MKVIPRWACVAMCDYSLSCGEINSDMLGGCMYDCDWHSGWLDKVDPNAATDLAQIAACYVGSNCAQALPTNCHPSDIERLAATFNPQMTWSATWPLVGYTTVGATSCLLESEFTELSAADWKLSCQSTIAQTADARMLWGLTCERPDTESDWSCTCWENGIATKTRVAGGIDPTDPGMLGVCWEADRMSCFYSGGSDC